MTTKEWFKRFHWGVAGPAVLTLAAGIAVAAAPAESYLARSVSVGGCFALSGLLCILAFFLGREENPVHMLAGVAQTSAALWMFVTLTTPLYVFCIAMAVVTALRAGGEIFEAVKKERGTRRYVRIAFAVCFVAACIVIPCDPFDLQGLLVYTGVVLLAEAVCGFIAACVSGLFAEEETPPSRTFRK